MAGSFGTSGAGGDDDLIAGINVTPLVDVVLVLLIIFLITAPVIYQSAIKVQLPQAKTGEASTQSPWEFSVTKEGAIVWNKETLDWDALGKRLATLKPDPEKETAVISADQAAQHGTVVRLMDLLRQTGLSRFALNVENTAK